jgi:DNA polymerase-1
MVDDKNILLIIDGNAIVHRAYHALPPLTNKKGQQLGAVYGFLLAFFKALKDFDPKYLAACFDFPAPNFRMEISKDYKAQRPKADQELYDQIPLVKGALKDFGAMVLEERGFEADDLIGTVSSLASKEGSSRGVESMILTGDNDVLQLMDEYTSACILRRGVKDSAIFDQKAVFEKYGLYPSQLVDYKALRGDPTDNIPGVRGIGPKTAVELLKEFCTLDRIYEELEKGSLEAGRISKRTREMLLSQKEQCLTSKILARIKTDTPVEFSLERCRWQGFDREKAAKVLENFEFFSLVKRLLTAEPDGLSSNPPLGFKKNLKLW